MKSVYIYLCDKRARIYTTCHQTGVKYDTWGVLVYRGKTLFFHHFSEAHCQKIVVFLTTLSTGIATLYSLCAYLHGEVGKGREGEQVPNLDHGAIPHFLVTRFPITITVRTNFQSYLLING